MHFYFWLLSYSFHDCKALQDQISALHERIGNVDARSEDPTKEEIIRLSEEVARLDAILAALKQNFLTVNDKIKEFGTLKDTVRVRLFRLYRKLTAIFSLTYFNLKG